MPNYIKQFTEDLSTCDLSCATVRGYGSDLTLFRRWFEGTNGQAFRPGAIPITRAIWWGWPRCWGTKT